MGGSRLAGRGERAADAGGVPAAGGRPQLAGVLPLGLPVAAAAGRHAVRPFDAPAGVRPGAGAARRPRPLPAPRDRAGFPWARRGPVRVPHDCRCRALPARGGAGRRLLRPHRLRQPRPAMTAPRDRDASGRARNSRPRDDFGRPLPYGSAGVIRVPDDLQLPPDEALAEAQRYLDEGHPFQAHAVLEASWKAAPEHERGLWRSLAQLCVGLTHAQRGNVAGATSLLTRGSKGLAHYAGTTPYGICVDRIVTDSAAWASQPASVGELHLVG